MALNGIDVASYQAALNLDGVKYDFVLIKATEGTTYVNPDCDTKYQEAKADGKLRGIYMFVDHGGDPEAEADYFVDNCQGYIGDGLLAVDWEGSFVEDTDYLHRILIRIEARTGVKPLAYMSEWVENHYDWSAVVADDYGLWGAKYSDYEIDNDYDTSNAGSPPVLKHWTVLALWQWTSRGRLSGYVADLDCDIFYGNTTAWNAYAAKPAPVPAAVPTPVPVAVQDNEQDGAVPVAVTTTTPTLPNTTAVSSDFLADIPATSGTPAASAPTATPAATTTTPSVKHTSLLKGGESFLHTLAGGTVLLTAALADPHVQNWLSLGLDKYVSPALLGLGLSTGLVTFIVNLIKGKLTKVA